MHTATARILVLIMTTRLVKLCHVIYAYSKATMIVSLISHCGEKIPLQTTVSVPPHAANPLDAELYTAVVCRPRSPGRTVHITHP